MKMVCVCGGGVNERIYARAYYSNLEDVCWFRQISRDHSIGRPDFTSAKISIFSVTKERRRRFFEIEFRPYIIDAGTPQTKTVSVALCKNISSSIREYSFSNIRAHRNLGI